MIRHTQLAVALTSFIAMGCMAFIAMAAVKQPADEDAVAEPSPPADSRSSEIERGEYLVHHVAMCIMCHTPKTPSGELIEQRLLQGSPIPVDAPYRDLDWALSAPNIAGLPGGWNVEDMAKFLQTGETPYDHEVSLPMPPFRMQTDDARAVAAYLKSLESD